MLKGWSKILAKEVVKEAIKSGKVDGNKIQFRIRDIGNRKGVMRFCMKTSKRIFKVQKDGAVNVYIIDYEVIKCLNDEEIEKMFLKKLTEEGEKR